MTMHANGQTTVWGTHVGVSRARDTKRWYQQLKAWWAEHRAARRAAHLVALRAGWDARREAVRPLQADTAIDMVVSTHPCSASVALCDLGV
jgi:hypothetical protein